LPLPVTIDAPGAGDEEVRRNFGAVELLSHVGPDVRALLTAHFHRRFENPFVAELRALRTPQAVKADQAGRAGTT
jgi:hypothetical protein